MNKLIRLPRIVAVTAAVVFLLILSIGKAGAQVTVPVDIKPGSCPNPINVKSKGVLPVAIVGTDDSDVTGIDIATVKLGGIDPKRSALEDVATPFEGEIVMASNCHELGADGFLDLTLKFRTDDIVAVLGPVTDGEARVLTLTGSLTDGTPFSGEDVVLILNPGEGLGRTRAPGIGLLR